MERESVLRRLADVTISGLMIVLLAPLLIAIAVAIKLESKGAIVFRQQRIGQNGKPIDVLKFRTMRVASEDFSLKQQAMKGDQRVTRIGRILRKTSLDELPQLFNVFAGDLALIGPSPMPLFHARNPLYGDILRQQLAFKPSLIGMSRVMGIRGGTESPRTVEAMMRVDLDYMRARSGYSDAKLLFRVLRSVLAAKNAY